MEAAVHDSFATGRKAGPIVPRRTFFLTAATLLNPTDVVCFSPKQDAKIPFMIADAVVLVAIYYIERGVKAERKLLEMEEHHADLQHESDKSAKTAVKAQQRAAQRHPAGTKKRGNTGNTRKEKHYHIQQPSKKD